MSEEKTNEQPQKREYTQEEIKTMKAKRLRFYQEEIKHLKLEEQYERLNADIEEHKVRRMTAMNNAAYIYAESEKAQLAYEAELANQANADQTPKVEEKKMGPETEVIPTEQPAKNKRQLKKD